MATLVAAETHGALAMATDLPDLPELSRRSQDPEALAGAADLWTRSWDDGDEGARMRQEAYTRAVPSIAAALGPSGVRGVLDPLLATIDAARAMDPSELPGFVTKGVERSAVLARDAETALDERDLGRALLLSLEAADGLRELGPEEVARELVFLAEEALAVGNGGAGSASSLDLERSRHLVKGAEEAMERNDFLRAIRRAFYACQLLGIDLD